MRKQRSTPPYSEEQATAWLAWLAYHMRRRDLTIFQIENLQPDWLVGRQETMPHLLSIRMLWGGMTGLTFGLILGSLYAGVGPYLIAAINLALVCGLIFGPISGLIGGLN